MPVEFTQDANRLYLRFSGEVTPEEHEQWAQELLNTLDHQKRWRLLVALIDFHAPQGEVLWENSSLDGQTINVVEKVAVVGDASRQRWVSGLLDAFSAADVKFFDNEDEEDARQWLEWSEVNEEPA